MKYILSGLCWASALAAPVLSDELPNFQEVVVGATAMTTLPGGYLLVSKPAGAFLCVIDSQEGYFVTLMQGGIPDASIPSAICTSVEDFKKMDIQ